MAPNLTQGPPPSRAFLSPLTQISAPFRLQSPAAEAAMGYIEAEAPAGHKRGYSPTQWAANQTHQGLSAAFQHRHLWVENGSGHPWTPRLFLANLVLSTERSKILTHLPRLSVGSWM